MDLFKPRGASSPRKPTDNNQKFGPMINTPRYAELGGLKGAVTHKGAQASSVSVAKPGDGKKVI